MTPAEIRLHCLAIAAGQRREVLRVGKFGDQDAEQPEDPNWLAHETLADAKVYFEWVNGDVPLTPFPVAEASP